MPKLGMEPIRRAQLIDATHECIHRYGFSGTTIAKVSTLAGVSTGIVNHYFGSKDDLLEAAMRSLLKKLGAYAVGKNLSNKSPKARIVAIIEGNFSLEQVAPRAVTVWFAFWGQAIHVPELRRLQKVNMRRLRSNLRFWFKKLLPDEHACEAADGLAALIDGLWLRGAFHENGIDARQARRLCRDYLDLQLEHVAKSGSR